MLKSATICPAQVGGLCDNRIKGKLKVSLQNVYGHCDSITVLDYFQYALWKIIKYITAIT